ncbi:MAG TPA: ubiquinol-cytochrome c reductase iron-sulfur subunit [Candidatus Angelobacter sp.]|jgi:menaquinol-cytochrome c reductase iron-sulfur subunit|nr:ubiquinol-cytochrome c reductase iron-sulfur subunit [Candidatus Angelobacter sp.]
MSATPVTRRRFLIRMTNLGAGAITLMLSIPAIGFLVSPLFMKRGLSWIRVGEIDGVPIGLPTPFTVSMPIGEGPPTPNVERIVYVVKSDSSTLRILSNTCSHMQCNVHWDPSLGQFLCPCHGGLYDLNGLNIGGPPPSPLPQWIHRTYLDPSTGRTVLEVQNQFDENI